LFAVTKQVYFTPLRDIGEVCIHYHMFVLNAD